MCYNKSIEGKEETMSQVLTEEEIIEVKRGLNPKQIRFAEELSACKNNQTKAAINAGYSPNSASVQASKLLTNPKVRMLADHHLGLVAKQCDIDAMDVLKELAHIGFANIGDYLTYDDDAVVLIPSEDLTREQLAAIQEITSTDTQWGTTVRIKLHPKHPALVDIGRYLRMFDKSDGDDKPEDNRTLEEIQADRKRAEKALKEAIGG